MIVVPEELIDAIADAVRERLAGELEHGSPWMTRPAAAEYLGLSLSRVEKDRAIPAHRVAGRVLYHRGELDEYALAQGASS